MRVEGREAGVEQSFELGPFPGLSWCGYPESGRVAMVLLLCKRETRCAGTPQSRDCSGPLGKVSPGGTRQGLSLVADLSFPGGGVGLPFGRVILGEC